MTSKKDVSVTHSNYDVIFKYLTEMFEDKALTFYGLETPPIVRAEKTDLPNIRVDERLMDFVFLRGRPGEIQNLRCFPVREEEDAHKNGGHIRFRH